MSNNILHFPSSPDRSTPSAGSYKYCDEDNFIEQFVGDVEDLDEMAPPPPSRPSDEAEHQEDLIGQVNYLGELQERLSFYLNEIETALLIQKL